MEANSGLELPLLEDANAIQVAIQEIMQAILDRRIDSKRAGLLLYSLQLASSNIRNLTPLPSDSGERICQIGDDDEKPFDCIGVDDRDEFCDENCKSCAEEDCETRTDETASIPAAQDREAPAPDFPSVPKKPPVPVGDPASEGEPRLREELRLLNE